MGLNKLQRKSLVTIKGKGPTPYYAAFFLLPTEQLLHPRLQQTWAHCTSTPLCAPQTSCVALGNICQSLGEGLQSLYRLERLLELTFLTTRKGGERHTKHALHPLLVIVTPLN